MKVFLDDTRATPEGWERVYRASEAIELLRTGAVELISLDYHLGDAEQGTGLDVLLWIEQAVRDSDFCPPVIRVHSDHRHGRAQMLEKLDVIQHSVYKSRNQ